MRRLLLTLVAVLALTATACGGDSDERAAGNGERPTTTADGGTTAVPGSTLELTAKGIAFDKTALTASAGAVSIRFDNQDAGIPHNLHVSGSGVDAKTEIEEGPATQTLDLDLEAGTYSYVCDVHPQQMKGELNVT